MPTSAKLSRCVLLCIFGGVLLFALACALRIEPTRADEAATRDSVRLSAPLLDLQGVIHELPQNDRGAPVVEPRHRGDPVCGRPQKAR